ncbi:MAG: histidine triad (HIT) protein [Epulopiscium sp. Nele67-Bin004]|nr:MAG: histidine triad (HIT) protein [Epulopiscium sp. Nele67-Bin004]
MNDCFYCEKGDKLNSLMIEICKLKYTTIYLNRDQKHKGRLIVAFNGHYTEYFQLTEDENKGYFAEMSLAAKVLDQIYQPDKINYATFGDKVPHLHMHIVPKHKDKLQWGRPFRDGGEEKVFLSETEYQEIVELFNKVLNELK